MTFGNWPEDIHSSADQLKRIASAKSSKTTPDKIDRVHMTGSFPGSGVLPYNTSLNSCTCDDFIRRMLPCKHIYRLAIEMGLLNEKAETGANKNTLEILQFSLKDAVSKVEKLNEAEQKVIRDFLYHALYHKETKFPILIDDSNSTLCHCALLEQIDSPDLALQALSRNQILQILDSNNLIGFKRNMSLKNLILWCVENVSNLEDIFPNLFVFQFCDKFQKAQRQVYSYLLRKYDWEIFYDVNMQRLKYPHGAKFGDFYITISANADGHMSTTHSGNPNMCFFPNDEITQLLTFYGHNRCLHGFLPQLDN